MKSARLTIALICLYGCVPVPYPVTPQLEVSDSVVLPSEDILVTLGPRSFLESLEKALTDESSRIEIADALSFRDAAFPEGGWTLAQLLAPGNCDRVRQQTGVDVVVLFGPLETESSRLRGPYIWPAGVGQATTESTLSAVLIDLESNDLVCQVDVTARGKYTLMSWGWTVPVLPMTESGAIAGMMRTLAEEIRRRTAADHPRVVLLAAEATRLWKPIGEGGWTMIAGSGANDDPFVYRVFDFCGLPDGQVTLQSAFDRAMELYRSEDYSNADQCFDFVIDAGSADSTLVAEARRYREFMKSAGLLHETPSETGLWEPEAHPDD